MGSVVRAVLLAALALALGAEGGGVATGKPKHADSICPATTNAGRVVGTVTRVLHSKVYVGRRYVGATPFAVGSHSHICTDGTGEAIFDLARSNKNVVCITLRKTDVQVTPSVPVAAAFGHGASWCSIRRSDRQQIAMPIGSSRLWTTKRALVGVVVRNGTIKVAEGSISLSTRRHRKAISVSRGMQVVVFVSGEISKLKGISLSSEERVAIAQLRLAQ
jgi:hypothetical protein